MKEKFKTLLARVNGLLPLNDEELEDILTKARMYINYSFKSQATLYLVQLSNISFTPPYKPVKNDKIVFWEIGRKELAKFLKTRIEELELIEEQKKKEEKPEIREVKVPYEDTAKIEELTKKLQESEKRKSLWKWINWSILVTIGIALISGAFFLGKDFGSSKFDQKMYDLNDENKTLKITNQKLEDSIKNLDLKYQKTLTKSKN